MIEKYLNNNELIICPNNIKEDILKYLNEHKLLYSIKFMDINEYKKKYLFDYDFDTTYYLVNKYDLTIDNAKNIINNLYYIDSNKKYDNYKLDELVSIKNDLDNNNLLKYNELFKKNLKKYNIFIYGYNLDKFDLSLFNYPTIIENPIIDKEYDYYSFNDIELEIEFVFNKIVELLNKNIDINNIKIISNNNEYNSYLKRFSNIYKIPINIKNNDCIMGTTLGKEFFSMIDSYTKIDIYNKLNSINNDLSNKLIGILNKYYKYELKDIKDFIKYDLLNTSIPNNKYNNCINVCELDSKFNDNDYVFLIGFNNSYPVTYLDTDYINDSIKNKFDFNMSTTLELNLLSKKNTLSKISNIKNLIISFSEKSPFNSYMSSNLLDDIKYNKCVYNNSFNYNDSYNKIKFCYYLDLYRNYGENSINKNDLNDLNSTYNIKYNTYDNRYTGINKDSLMEYLNNKLNLSYSSVNNYYECGFKYYLSNILNIDKFEKTFYMDLGNLFHNMLRNIDEKDYDFIYHYNDSIKDSSLKDKYFYEKLKPELFFIIDVIKKQELLTGLNNHLFEQRVEIPLNDNPLVVFKGFIDKVMYTNRDGKNIVSIIDYKTGNVDIKLDLIKFGLSMQLPSYLYLMKKSNILDNIVFSGFYLQHILNINIKRDLKKSYDEQKLSNLKLEGYSNLDTSILSIWDSSYENSEMIKGLKVKTDGTFYSNSKVISDESMDSIIDTVDSNVKNAMKDILNTKFDINPKIIDGSNKSCEFCKYKDICFVKEQDKVYLTKEDTNNGLDE